jgi:histone H3/H4
MEVSRLRLRRLAEGTLRKDCWSRLICDLAEGEELTIEADDLLTAVAGELLTQFANETCEAAQRRGSKIVGKDDVRFAADSIFTSDHVSEEADRPPSKEHEQRLEALRRFRESEDQ